MTKTEAYELIFKDMKVHIEGIDWEGEADEKFMNELKVIKEMAEELTKNKDKWNNSNIG